MYTNFQANRLKSVANKTDHSKWMSDGGVWCSGAEIYDQFQLNSGGLDTIKHFNAKKLKGKPSKFNHKVGQCYL